MNIVSAYRITMFTR